MGARPPTMLGERVAAVAALGRRTVWHRCVLSLNGPMDTNAVRVAVVISCTRTRASGGWICLVGGLGCWRWGCLRLRLRKSSLKCGEKQQEPQEPFHCTSKEVTAGINRGHGYFRPFSKPERPRIIRIHIRYMRSPGISLHKKSIIEVRG
jgi:hypothetical protein